MEFIIGMMGEYKFILKSSMKACGIKTKCMKEEPTCGQMDENTKGDIIKTKNMDMGYILGEIEEHMKAIGL